MSKEPTCDLVASEAIDLRAASVNIPKRPYTRPSLSELGSVRALTLATAGTVTDGGGLQPTP